MLNMCGICASRVVRNGNYIVYEMFRIRRFESSAVLRKRKKIVESYGEILVNIRTANGVSLELLKMHGKNNFAERSKILAGYRSEK